ncbi:MAG: HK97-gp10 family putative phage morphogenesis protein [Variibacter sp.]
MADDDDLQRYLGDLPFKVKRELVTAIRAEADKLAAEIKAAAPQGETGHLAESVRVRRKRNELELEVLAGGPLTTKDYGRKARYEREVVIGSGDTEGIDRVDEGGYGVTYDYALAAEFGTRHQPAEPFFYSTYQEKREGIMENINAAVERALG